jgi:hypothetical protein
MHDVYRGVGGSRIHGCMSPDGSTAIFYGWFQPKFCILIQKNMSEEKNKVTTEELVAYFWEQGDITTREKVDVVFHEDTLVDVSVMLRNVEDDVETMVQISAVFDPVQDFIDAFAITDVAQVHEIGLVDLFVLYKEGLAEMNVIAERVE